MTTPLEPFYQLKCSCNSYPWGKQGSSSLAAHYCAQTPGYAQDSNVPNSAFSIDESTPYAEMWMGTYPTLPSYVASTSEPLQDVIDRHAEKLLGKGVVSKFGHTQLPFLPKILSISKALPLQIHPNKEFAAKMHKENPDQFSDPNHKPEIAVALTKFEAFCGFKPLADIASLLNLEPLKGLLTSGDASSGKFNNEDLRALVENILTSPEDRLKDIYHGLKALPSSALQGTNGAIPKLAPRLAEQYSSADPGVAVALLTMNYLVLEPGEAIYIPADGIHAYLSGDIVECMARSDNVLNTGFCPAGSRDNATTFSSLLTFSPHKPSDCMLPPKKYWRSGKGKTIVYAPPLSEFNVVKTELGAGEDEVLGSGGASIAIATKGGAKVQCQADDGGEKEFELKEGQIYFISQGQKLNIKAGDAGLEMYGAYVGNSP